MKHRLVFHSLLLLAVFLSLAPTSLASSKWYVDGVNGSDNNNCKSPQHACKTIGHAISLASSGDSIMVAAATYTENLTIGFSLRLVGASAVTTIIDGGSVGRVVIISNASAHVTLSNLTMRNGQGGIGNSGMLTVNNSTLSGNSASVGGCTKACRSGGGGIYNDGTLTINRTTISGNGANIGACVLGCYAQGGGIYNGGALAISNSTLSGNIASMVGCDAFCYAQGGGIYNYYSSTLTINNSTISGNSAKFIKCTGSACYVQGGGIFGSATLQNSIVANNDARGLPWNCYGTITSKGYNLGSDGTCRFNNTGDLNNTDPKLGPLQNNGGPTQTQALLDGSPAIDAGNLSGCTDGKGHLLKTDQRGKPRPDKEDTGGCDMGAYERQKD